MRPNLGASHYSQYLGMSAGVTALVLAAQPLVTAVIAATLLNERLRSAQWLGVFTGLAGVALVVWHKDRHSRDPRRCGRRGADRAGRDHDRTLYQRAFCPTVDLRAASLVQFTATLLVLAPLAVVVEGRRCASAGRCWRRSRSSSSLLRSSRSTRCTR